MKKQFRILLTALLTASLVGALTLLACASETEEPVEAETEKPEAPMDREPVELQIFADSSLTSVINEIQELYKEDHNWVTFSKTRYFPSENLVANLAAGFNADLLLTDSKASMNVAEDKELVDITTREDIFTTDLVIIAKEGLNLSDVTLEDIATGKYSVAVGDNSLPVGRYAAQSLSTVDAYRDPSGEIGPKALGQEGEYVGIEPLMGTKVSDVCALVESGEAEVAIVCGCDAYNFSGVEIVGTIPSDTHKTIVYPGAICTDSEYIKDTEEFLTWATTDEKALKVWQKWGFDLLA